MIWFSVRLQPSDGIMLCGKSTFRLSYLLISGFVILYLHRMHHDMISTCLVVLCVIENKTV